MGASRKLQGEIDRVLKKVQEGVEVFDSIWNKVYDTANANQKEKFEADLKKEIKKLQRYRDQIKTWIQSSEIKDKKVSASYEQALMDARKLIEREMERFKICEKETKTKAFSKEGLGQQPKTDPKEKAKSETRDWLNNGVGELESQIDNFEAEIEGLSVKKGRTRPPRLTHLETSIARHKAHIMKLELILRLLDNDELSPEQVNDVKDFLEDYVERNQEDFEEFHEVDELYSSLPLDKVESLEELVTMGPPGHSKVAGISAVSSLKGSVMPSPANATATGNVQQSSLIQEHIEDAVSQESNSDNVPRTPSAKSNAMLVPVSSVSAGNPPMPAAVTATQHISGASVVSAVYPGSVSAKSGSEIASNVAVKEDGFTNISARKPSPVFTDSVILRSPGGGGLTNPSPSGTAVGSGSAITSSGPLVVPHPLDAAKRNVMIADEKLGINSLTQSAVSPLTGRVIMQQAPSGIPSADSGFTSDTTLTASRSFSPSLGPGLQWRPGSSFHPQSDTGQFRGRTEIAPDQREKFLQRLQQVQQVHGSIPQMPSLSGVGNKNLFTQQQTPLLTQASGLSIGPALSQSSSIQPQANQQALLSSVADSDASTAKVDEQHHRHNQPDDPINDSLGTGPDTKDGDSKTLYGIGVSGGIPCLSTEPVERFRDTDHSHGQLLQSSQPSGGLGVIGRRSAPDLGAIGDSMGGNSGNSSGGIHDQLHNLQMLEAAYYKLPQPKDSERMKTYIPRHPAVTPSSYPQVQAPIVNNPAFWERLGVDPIGIDTLFFAFYYQQNTYQQYLAAKELKKQSWRYHRKYNTWFQRHEEPKVATDEYEQGTYVYFDFHVPGDDQQHGWCQRIKTDFAFEYNYLEDELIT